MFLGTGRVASITAEERESGLLDYQRMTPMNPFSKIIGYIFGIPAREYYMFFFTLPFLAHAVLVGNFHWGCLPIVRSFPLLGGTLSSHCPLCWLSSPQTSRSLLGFPHSRSWLVCGTAWTWAGGDILPLFSYHSPNLLWKNTSSFKTGGNGKVIQV